MVGGWNITSSEFNEIEYSGKKRHYGQIFEFNGYQIQL
jgi:hypothetical protein